MDKIKSYALPVEDVNEDTAIITEVCYKNGDYVQKGDIIYTFETTKATIDVLSENDGYIKYDYTKGKEVKVGTIVCEISTLKNISEDIRDYKKKNINFRLTKKASEYVEKNNIDISQLNLSGIVKENDIHKLYKQFSCNTNISDKITFHDKDVVIIGVGGHANCLKNLIEKDSTFKFRGYISQEHIINNNEEIIGSDNDLPTLFDQGLKNIILGVGDIKHKNLVRKKLFDRSIYQGFGVPNLIDGTSIVEESVSLGVGNQLLTGAIVGHRCELGNNIIINNGAIVCHDVKIKDNVHIAPGAIIAANVEIGENSLIGMGVTIYRGVSIGKNVLIANGVNIYKNVPDNTSVT